MSVHGYTKNYKLIKPKFDADTWHDHEYDNLDTIDAVLSAIYASGDWQGFWKNNTSYKAGSVVIDKDTDTMYKVVADHTTDGNVTFAEYMFNHPEYYQLWSPNNLAQDWAIKDDGLADNQDYSAKAYAVGGVGTETNNAKYYSEQAGLSANMSAEQAAASASSATASYNSEQLALSYANQSASSASASQSGAEQSTASAAISQEKAEYAANSVAGLEAFVQEKQNEISASLAEAIKASEDAKKYAVEASGANIGDIFYTSRLDTELNGAVDADGAVYSVAAFTGEKSVPALLADGKLPYVSMAEYESIVSANGSCRAWGWDNGDTFRVPLLKDVYLMAGQAETAGEFISESLPNITGSVTSVDTYRLFVTGSVTTTGCFDSTDNATNYIGGSGSSSSGNSGINIDASNSSSTYQDGAKVRPDSVRYRAMVQLSTGVKEDATKLKEYKFNNPHFFGESKWTDVDPNNASWLVSNGNFHSGRTYGDYYNWLTDIKSGNKTVEGVSVKSVDDEYTDYDWVINTADTTFRLPLLNGSEDLPDSSDKAIVLKALTSSGTVSEVAPKNGWAYAAGSSTGSGYFTLSRQKGAASQTLEGDTAGTFTKSNNIKSTLFAKKGDTVYCYATGDMSGNLYFIPATGNGTLYYYVGDTLQDPTLINAGAVLNDIAEVKRRQIVMSIPATSGAVSLEDNTIYSGTMAGAMTFVLPTVTYATQYHQIKAMLYLPVVTINWGTAHYIGGEAPDVSKAGQYMIYWDYVPALSAWAVGVMKVV